jgi:hypothetical protein
MINEKLTRWLSLKPIYFPTWAWAVAVKRNPTRYSMNMPEYQGQKVILT